MQAYIKEQWFKNPIPNLLSGVVVALALIPEALSFSIIAGLDPMAGLYASVIIAIVMAFIGGRTALISAATGAIALLVVPLVKDYGINYLLAATILMGIIQLILGILRVGRLMRFIPNAVMVGFVDALAILIFHSQFPYLTNQSWLTYVFVAASIAIVYLLPKLTRAIPAPLVAVVVLTAITMVSGVHLQTVGDLGHITAALPHFEVPKVPFTLETLSIIWPYSLSMALVGLMETLLTAKLVDDITDTTSSKDQEARGQGIANIIQSFFGGMGGSAMIGQTMINVTSGARTRLSTFTAGAFLMILIIGFAPQVSQIPMAVLAGIMIMVAIGTFDWQSFAYLKKVPWGERLVTILVVVIVVLTNNLAIGVAVGTLLGAIFFAKRISDIKVKQQVTGDQITYFIKGQIFFASTDGLSRQIDLHTENKQITLDFAAAHVWDESAVNTLDKLVMKLHDKGNHVTIANLNEASLTLSKQLATEMHDVEHVWTTESQKHVTPFD